jgi:hypothetical protein
MPTATLTKPGTPKLSEVARQVHAPSGIVSTGWPSVEAKCVDLGISFRWWQPPIGRLILAKRADGTYASTVGGTGLSIPRQVGKTFLVAAIMFALCLLRPGFTVLWTAHRLKTAEETFGKLQVFARRRKIAPHIKQIKTGSGEQQIIFRNGSRILIGARERGFGRGFDEVDAEVFDEAQHLTDAALDDMVPAMNQSRQPEGALMLFMGTPPRPQDPGEVFARMRADAEAGDEDTGWVEFGAAPDYLPTPLPAPLDDADWGQIATANPSFPEDTSRTAILRLRKKLGDSSFLREGLGIWGARSVETTIPLASWLALSVGTEVEMVSPQWSLELEPDRSKAHIGAAWRVDGAAHLEVVEELGELGVVARLTELARKYDAWAVTVDGQALPEDDHLVTALREAGLTVSRLNPGQRAAACGALHDLTVSGDVSHNGDPAVIEAIEASDWTRSEGARAFSRRRSEGSIAPLYAITFALHGLMTAPDYDPLDSFY